jgi:pSer/pThr/pTyr-binding forkhead associated (FHA) protein
LQIEPNPLTTQLPRIDLNADEVKKLIFAFTSGDILEVPIGDKRQLRMGRRATQSGQLLDIDLQPFKAEEMGVSRMHCAIEIIDNQLHIADLGSTNGTFLNGLRIHEPRPLRNGDLLRIGNLTMTIRFSQ